MSVETQVQRDVLCPVCGQSVLPPQTDDIELLLAHRPPEFQGMQRQVGVLNANQHEPGAPGTIGFLLETVARLPFAAPPSACLLTSDFPTTRGKTLVRLEMLTHPGPCTETFERDFAPALEAALPDKDI